MWSAATVLGATALPKIALAQAGQNPFEKAGEDVKAIGGFAGVGTDRTPQEIIGSIINIALGFLGIVLLAYLLYAGFLWMTAGGSSEKVDQAKGMIKNAIIGLVIIVAAFAISNFVLTSLVGIAQG
jgi:hypothetical protein